MSFIRDLSRRMANITKEEPIEEEHYEVPKIMDIYIKTLREYITHFKLNHYNITEPYVTQFLWTLNELSLEYARFAEDYSHYLKEFNPDSTIIKTILKKKELLQAKFKKVYREFEKVAMKSNIQMSFILEKMENVFDFDDAKWNEIANEPTRTYLASDPTLGKN